MWNVWRRHICVEKSLWRIHNSKTRECQHEKIWQRTALSWVRGNGKYRGILIEGTVSNCKKKGLLSCSETSGSLTLLRSGCSTPTGNTRIIKKVKVKRRSLLESYIYIYIYLSAVIHLTSFNMKSTIIDYIYIQS